jgi:D-alanine--poly(phosphoribitol) ligase subunit 2
MNRDEIATTVRSAIDELNPQIPENRRVNPVMEGPLFGDKAPLDSLGLVELIVLIEERLFDKTGTTVTLTDERAFSQKNSPFRTVNSLVTYIETILHE